MTRAAACLFLLATAATPALAQEAAPSPPGTIAPPGSRADNPKSPGAAATTTGEVVPPANVDPGIKVAPPVAAPEPAMPVVPPPGSPGGDPSVQPK